MDGACLDCFNARTQWTWGGYFDGCEGCNIRGIAVSPKFVREHFYEQTREKGGEDALKEMKRKVSEEWARIRRLRESTERTE